MNNKIPFIKADAVIDLKLGSAMIKQLESLLDYLSTNLTKTDADTITTKIKEKKPLEQKEAALVTISTLIAGIYDQAKLVDAIEYKDSEDAFTDLVQAQP
jgi:hypothetical protein